VKSPIRKILQLAHFVEHHGVADVDVGGGGVEAELDAQRHAGGLGTRQLGQPIGLGQQFVAAAFGHGHGVQNAISDGMQSRPNGGLWDRSHDERCQKSGSKCDGGREGAENQV
jgi:hypothetical protein